MLYSYDDTLKIILRIYEYLQLRVKAQPRTLKMYSQRHRNSVVAFMEKLPPSAGADFIWEFFVFQFYIYQDQDQILRPMPVWFMGDEAWRRWREYDEGARCPRSRAFCSTNRVCGIVPSYASTRRTTPFTILRIRSTSPPKSA